MHPPDPAAFWDEQAAAFDDEPDHGLADPRTRDAWRRLLLERLPAPPADVVDLGCGTGSLSVLLAAAGFRVPGLDLSGAMVAAARSKAVRSGVEVAFAQGDAADPPYPAASGDVVLCRHVLWALPDPSSALARWVALLRPGGRLLLVEGRWHTGSGLARDDCERLVREHRADVEVTPLDDPVLWGGAPGDDRYLVLSTR